MRKQSFVVWFTMLVGISGIVVACLAVYNWSQPLGPRLDLSVMPPRSLQVESILPATAEATSNVSPVITTTATTSDDEAISTLPAPTPTPKPLCNGPRTMTILAIGSDQRDTGYRYGLADSIHVARIDFSIPNLMVVDFPRDLWVEIPDISDHYGITHGKLNQAYLYGNPGMGYYDGTGEGPGLLARTLNVNYGVRVDHYIAIDSQTFIRMIDAVGGVEIMVETPIDLSYGNDSTDPKYYLSVGMHHLDGEMAYILATNRIPTTFQRMEYQKIILSALREKVLSPAILPKIPKLITQFIGSVQTDLSPSDISSLVCIVQSISGENIQADSFPQEMFTSSNVYDSDRRVYTFVYKVDNQKLRLMIEDFMNGTWPMAEP